MNNRAGFAYTQTDNKKFKLANSSDSSNKTTLEGFRYIINENFQVSEIELGGLESILKSFQSLSKIKYRNSSYSSFNFIQNSDFSSWENGTTFPFDSNDSEINTSDFWKVKTSSSTGTCFRAPFIPQNQVEVPESPQYYLGLYCSNFVGKPQISQRINDAQNFNGLTLSLSSYLRATENSISIKYKIKIHYGENSNFEDDFLESPSLLLTKNFNRYFHTVSLPSDILSKIDGQSYIDVIIEPQELGIYEIHASSIQLESSPTPSPYKSNTYLENQSLYLVDTLTSAITLSLDPNPFPGFSLGIYDISSNFSINKLTIDPQGRKLSGSTSLYEISQRGILLHLLYINDSIGWVFSNSRDPSILDSGNSRISQTQNLVNSLIIAI